MEQRAASDLARWATELIEKRIATYEARYKRAEKRHLDGESVHDLRTSARRLRGALEDLGPLVAYSRRNLRLAKRVGVATGEARDLAVLIGRLQTYRALAGRRECDEIDALVKVLKRRERRALKNGKRELRACGKMKRPPKPEAAT